MHYKIKGLLLAFFCVVAAACDFTVPLAGPPAMTIDDRAVGLWERTKSSGNKERLLVLPLNKREYFVSWPEDNPTELYAKSHLFEFNGRTLVQVEWFGNSDGVVAGQDDNRNFQIASYNVSENRLEIRLLNARLVGKDWQSSEELAGAIENNSDNPELFLEAMVYTKVKL